MKTALTFTLLYWCCCISWWLNRRLPVTSPKCQLATSGQLATTSMNSPHYFLFLDLLPGNIIIFFLWQRTKTNVGQLICGVSELTNGVGELTCRRSDQAPSGTDFHIIVQYCYTGISDYTDFRSQGLNIRNIFLCFPELVTFYFLWLSKQCIISKRLRLATKWRTRYNQHSGILPLNHPCHITLTRQSIRVCRQEVPPLK